MKKHLTRRIDFSSKYNIFAGSAVAVAVFGIGLYTLASLAAGIFIALEPENGQKSASAQVVSNGEGGNALQFGSIPQTDPSNGAPAPDGKAGLRGRELYVHTKLADESRPAEISGQQVGHWVGGWLSEAQTRAEADKVVSSASAVGKLALLVTYNIPNRDCGQYSAGGAGNSEGYRSWLREFAAGVGQREAIVVVEPDALAQLDTCLDAGGQETRLADLAYTVDTLKAQTKAYVYIDGGHSTWTNTDTMANRLQRANIASADGFATNVSNFNTTISSAAYSDELSQKVGGKRYVIDTSRNGRGIAPGGEWCNPPGRGLGAKPTTSPTVGTYSDAFLWIKTVGESDGPCNGGPAAGQWFEAYAQGLIQNANYDPTK